jgi:hypothetical protein
MKHSRNNPPRRDMRLQRAPFRCSGKEEHEGEPLMQRAIYCVVEGRQGWMIRLNGREFGPLPARDFALEVAMRAGIRAHEMGCHSQVVLHDGDCFRTVWVNGRDRAEAAA